MSERFIGINLRVTCADHGTHEGVTMKIVDDVVVCVTADGERLQGDCCVTLLEGGTFVVPPIEFAEALAKYRGQNQ